MRPLVPGHVQDVAEAARGDHPDLGALALDHHVGGDRGAVEQHVDVGRRHVGAAAQAEHPVHYGDRLVVRRARHLVHHDALPAAAMIIQYEVGERAADIDAHPHLPPLPRLHHRLRHVFSLLQVAYDAGAASTVASAGSQTNATDSGAQPGA